MGSRRQGRLRVRVLVAYTSNETNEGRETEPEGTRARDKGQFIYHRGHQGEASAAQAGPRIPGEVVRSSRRDPEEEGSTREEGVPIAVEAGVRRGVVGTIGVEDTVEEDTGRFEEGTGRFEEGTGHSEEDTGRFVEGTGDVGSGDTREAGWPEGYNVLERVGAGAKGEPDPELEGVQSNLDHVPLHRQRYREGRPQHRVLGLEQQE